MTVRDYRTIEKEVRHGARQGKLRLVSTEHALGKLMSIEHKALIISLVTSSLFLLDSTRLTSKIDNSA